MSLDNEAGEGAPPERIRLSAAKLSPPTLTPHAIARSAPTPDHMLPRVKLVLFSAPAGFGKTTAMLQWIEHVRSAGAGTGWVTLDAQDNDIGRFLGYLVAALNRCGGEAHEDNDRGSLFDSQTAPLGSLLDVIDRLSSIGNSFAIFLDDYESITDPAIHELVRQVIDNLPTGSHLVIGSRTMPPLGLGKLRAREQLIEVGTDLLRFSLADAMHYFNEVRHLSISDRDVAELHRCTEGWATAIQLASLSIAGQTNVEKVVRSFGGDQSAIADYLAEDVFSRQAPLVQEFLLKTSILDSLNPDICNALTGRSDGGILLEQIEKANLFLVALDSVRNSYRYHNLFADFLRGLLGRLHPEQVAELNNRAAAWYEAEGVLTTALEHALAAGNTALATTLLGHVAEVLLYEGRVATLIRYVESLPKEATAGLVSVRLAYAWALIFAHRYQEAKLVLASFGQNNGELDERSRDEILTLGPCVLLWSDRIDECIVIAAENLPKLSGRGDFACGALINIYAVCLTTESRFSEAQEMLSTAKRHMARANSDYGLVYADCIEGLIHFSQGRLRTALAQFETVFRYASQRSRYSSASAVAASYLAEAWYEEDNIDAAEELLCEYLLLIRQTGLPDHIIAAHRILCRIAFTRGAVEEAQFQLSEMEHLGLARGSSRVVSSARLEKARIALIHGDLELAASLIKREEAEEGWRKTISGTPHANEVDDIRLYNIRLRLKAGAGSDAMALLRLEFDAAKQPPTVTRRHLLLKLLHAKAQDLVGNRESAHKNMIEVLEFAAEEGHKHLILDENYLVASMLEDLLRKVVPSSKAARLLEQLTGQPAGDQQSVDTTALRLPQEEAVDALTHREMQILALVAAGHSNREMANKLFLSEATIKTHMRNISSKLGVHSRTQAIALARSRHLI